MCKCLNAFSCLLQRNTERDSLHAAGCVQGPASGSDGASRGAVHTTHADQQRHHFGACARAIVWLSGCLVVWLCDCLVVRMQATNPDDAEVLLAQRLSLEGDVEAAKAKLEEEQAKFNRYKVALPLGCLVVWLSDSCCNRPC